MKAKSQDEMLWKMAKRRAAFKQHFSTYIFINLFLWAIWWFTVGKHGTSHGQVPWPVWTTVSWGLVIGFHYMSAFGPAADRQSAIEQEYEKLKRLKG